MRPDLKKERQISWAIFGGVVLLAAIAASMFTDDAGLNVKLQSAQRSYQDRIGPQDMQQFVNDQQLANTDLAGRIEKLKSQTGMQPMVPFIVPEGYNPSQYFSIVYNQVWDQLLEKSRNNRELQSKDYDQYLGLKFLDGKPLKREQVDQALKYLQLITKATYLALSAEDNSIVSLKIVDVDQSLQGKQYAAPGQQPLLREFDFKMEVRGSLLDLTWLLHELSVDRFATERQKDFKQWLQTNVTQGVNDILLMRGSQMPEVQTESLNPLIVKDIGISSENNDPNQRIAQLDLVVHLAGMSFLSPEERGQEPVAAARASSTISSTGFKVNTNRGSSGGY